MPAPYVIEIVQGETLFRELRVQDTDGVSVDLSSATKSVTMEAGISAGDFTIVDGTATGYLELRADDTETLSWALGFRKGRVWLDWGVSADVEKEILIEFKVKVRAAL